MAAKRLMRDLAPRGYYARAASVTGDCEGCAFQHSAPPRCGIKRRCCACERPDKRAVIFIKKRRRTQ